jgi:hypothetical protein
MRQVFVDLELHPMFQTYEMRSFWSWIQDVENPMQEMVPDILFGFDPDMIH